MAKKYPSLTKLINLAPLVLIFLISTLYFIAILLRHFRLESFAYDLGIFSQEIYQLSRFHLPFSTIKIPNMVIWGDHWSPSMFVLVPLVWLTGRPDLVLLISQVIFMSFAAWIIWILALRETRDRLFSLVLIFVFLTFYGLQNAIFFDAHPFFFASMLIPLVYWLYRQEKWFLLFLVSFVIANFKENLPLYLISFGLYLLIKKKYKQGIFLAGFYGLWFILVTRFLIPYFSPSGEFNYAQSLPPAGEMISRLFQPSIKLKVAFFSFWNYSFLPLASPFSILLIGVNFLENFTGEGILAGRWGFDRHYKVILDPLLAIGAVEIYTYAKKIRAGFTSRQVKKIIRLVIIGNMFLSALFSQYYLHLQLNMLSKKDFWRIGSPKKQVLKIIDRLNRESASVASQNNLLPHLAGSEKRYLLSYLDQNGCRVDNREADYILVYLPPDQSVINLMGCSNEEILTYLNQLVKQQNYHLLIENEHIYLLRRLKGI